MALDFHGLSVPSIESITFYLTIDTTLHPILPVPTKHYYEVCMMYMFILVHRFTSSFNTVDIPKMPCVTLDCMYYTTPDLVQIRLCRPSFGERPRVYKETPSLGVGP